MSEETKKEKNIAVDGEYLKNKIIELASMCTVSGYEHRTIENIKEIYGKSFDSIESDSVGNHIFFKACECKL